MKVTTDTPELLIVENRPVFLGIMLTGFILIFVTVGLAMTIAGEWWGIIFALFGGGIGFIAFSVMVRRVQVVFHRPNRYVEIRHRGLRSSGKVRYRLDEIARAEIEESYSSESTTWRVVLVIEKGESAGRHPITQVFSNGSGHHTCAEAINRWLAAARQGRQHETG